MSMDIVQILYRESKKEALEYRRYALCAFGTILHELNIDKFKEVYEIVQEIWTMVCINNKNKMINYTFWYMNIVQSSWQEKIQMNL